MYSVSLDLDEEVYKYYEAKATEIDPEGDYLTVEDLMVSALTAYIGGKEGNKDGVL